MIAALVPLKDLVQAKTRLSGLLGSSERRALAQAMAEDVLAVLRDHPRIDKVMLVSDDPGAAMLANQYGADYLSERGLGVRGLNPVIDAACARLLADGADTLLVLHGDLPLLDGAEIDAVLELQREENALVIATDTEGTGTNLLAFAAGAVPDFQFGPGSCERHRQWGGDTARIVSLPGLALDVDAPADLRRLLEHGATGKTAAMLRDGGLETRLRLALEMPAPAPRENGKEA